MSNLLEQYRKRKDNIKTGSESIWEKLESGENYVRFIANPVDGGFYTQGLQHNNLELLGIQKPSLFCGKAFGGGKCAICELLEELGGAKDASTLDTIKKCSAKIRCFSYVYILPSSSSNTPPEGGLPKILSFGPKVEEALLGIYLDPDYGDFTDVQNGRVITISKTGKGRDTAYSILPRPMPSKFTCSLEGLKPIEAVIPPRPYKEVKALLTGEEVEADDPDEREDVTPKYVEATLKPKEAKGGKRDCFGDGDTFSPKSKECKGCPDNEECKAIFIRV